MSINLFKLKNILNVKSYISDASVSLEPQIGFKLSYSESMKQLKVKLIGARHLPTVYGTSKPSGYIVKVCCKIILNKAKVYKLQYICLLFSVLSSLIIVIEIIKVVLECCYLSGS